MVERIDSSLDPGVRKRITRIGCVGEPAEHGVGKTTRLRPLLKQFGEAFLLETRHVSLWKAWRANDVGEEAHRRGESFRRDRDSRGRAVPISGRIERGTQTLESLGKLSTVAILCAFRECLGSECCNSFTSPWVRSSTS